MGTFLEFHKEIGEQILFYISDNLYFRKWN